MNSLRALVTLSVLLLFTPVESSAATVEIPVDIGIGPAAHFITGPIQDDQLVHTGLVISVQAIIDKAVIKKYKKRIPEKYRQLALSMDEVRFSPSIFIPDTLIISPGYANTGIYGVSWRPIGMGVPFVKSNNFRLGVNAGLRLTYLFIHSSSLASPTHFLRPGIDLKGNCEIPFSKSFLVSIGWNSQVYIPQKVGGGIASVGTLDESIWHVGQAYLKFHYRFPYKVSF
jgi:hypothetical protein